MMASSAQAGGAIIFSVVWHMTFGDRSVSGIATGASDLFAAQGELKVEGEPFEQQSYLDAVLRTSAGCADQGLIGEQV